MALINKDNIYCCHKTAVSQNPVSAFLAEKHLWAGEDIPS